MWEVQQCFSRKFTTERILPVAVNRGGGSGGGESCDAAALEFGIMNRIKRVTLSMMVYIVKCVYCECNCKALIYVHSVV